MLRVLFCFLRKIFVQLKLCIVLAMQNLVGSHKQYTSVQHPFSNLLAGELCCMWSSCATIQACTVNLLLCNKIATESVHTSHSSSVHVYMHYQQLKQLLFIFSADVSSELTIRGELLESNDSINLSEECSIFKYSVILQFSALR